MNKPVGYFIINKHRLHLHFPRPHSDVHFITVLQQLLCVQGGCFIHRHHNGPLFPAWSGLEVAADIGAAWRTPIRRTRPKLIGGFTVEVDVTGSACGLMCSAGHIVTGSADRDCCRVTVGVTRRIEGDSSKGRNMIYVLGVSALTTEAAKVIAAGIILPIPRIWRIGMAGITGTAASEGVTIINGIAAVIVTGATDSTTVVAV